MLSTRRSRGSGRQALAHLALLLAACFALALFSLAVFGGDRVQANPPNPPHGDGVHPGGGNGGLDNSGHGFHQEPPPPPPPPPDPPPDNPPPDNPPPARQAARAPPGGHRSGATRHLERPTATGLSGVAGAIASGHAGGHSDGGPERQRDREAPRESGRPRSPSQGQPRAVQGPEGCSDRRPGTRRRSAGGNPNRSTFADRLLSPTQIDLSAKNLGEGGLLRPPARGAALSAGDDLQQGDREEPRGDQGAGSSARAPGFCSSSAGSRSGGIRRSP